LLRRQGATVIELDRLLRGNGYRLFRNAGERNAAHDNFVVAELSALMDGGRFLDVVAVHRDDERLAAVVANVS
jgi:hypothetical protein